MLDDIFKKLALKREHAAIYSALLESGALPAGNLAKRLNMARSTLYGFLYDLLQAGLVIQSENNGVKIWQANEPNKIDNLINEKIDSLQELKNEFGDMLVDLKSKQKTDVTSPHFSYFEGSEGIKQILRDVLLYENIEIEAAWPIKDMVEVVGKDFLINHNKKRIKSNISMRMVWPKEKAMDIKNNIFLGVGEGFKREIRLAPKEIDFSMGYWAYSDKVAFVSSNKEGFGFIVQSKEFRQLVKMQFSLLWNISKPIKVDPKFTDPFLESIDKSNFV